MGYEGPMPCNEEDLVEARYALMFTCCQNLRTMIENRTAIHVL
jgi:hypothetical protein